MLFVKTSDDVDAVSLLQPFLVQCPKTKVIHVVLGKRYGVDTAYYISAQHNNFIRCNHYITNDSALSIGESARYYFTDAQLKSLIKSKRFTLAGCT